MTVIETAKAQPGLAFKRRNINSSETKMSSGLMASGITRSRSSNDAIRTQLLSQVYFVYFN